MKALMALPTLVQLTIISCLLIFMPGCVHRSTMFLQNITVPLNEQKTHTLLAPAPPINIWIHGTLFINKPLFHKVFDKKFALNLAIYMNKHFYAHTIAELLGQQDPVMFPPHTTYVFGWEGKLSANARLEAGKNLYMRLTELVKKYQEKWKQYPVIRIITHSHGGNVALNLAFAEQLYQQQLKIDTLLLLACPMQKETMHYASHPMFNQIYSLHSSLDLVQVIAPQQGASRVPFSKRLLPHHSHIIQAKVRLNGKAILHTQFTSKRFIQTIPKIIETLHSLKQNSTFTDHETIILRITARKKKLPALTLKHFRMRAFNKKKSYLVSLIKKNGLLLSYL